METSGFEPIGDRRSMYAKTQVHNQCPFYSICREAGLHGHLDCLKLTHEMNDVKSALMHWQKGCLLTCTKMDVHGTNTHTNMHALQRDV